MTQGNYTDDIKVAIVDDDAKVKELIRLILDEELGFRCVETYSCCDNLLQDFLKSCPDIILLDSDMPGIKGVECVQRVHQMNPGVEILMLSARDNAELIFKSLCAGASGYLIKGVRPQELLAAIRQVMIGGADMSRDIAVRVQHMATFSNFRFLSSQETYVLDCMAGGETYSTSAKLMNVSVQTIKCHIRSIYRRLEMIHNMKKMNTHPKIRTA